MRIQWNRYIIQYSHEDQLRILFAFRREVMNLGFSHDSLFLQKVSGKKRSASPSCILLASLASLFAILAIYWGFKRRKRMIGINLLGHPPPETSFYLKILRIFSKKRIPKRSSETSVEFAQRIRQRRNDLYPTIERVTDLYNRVRFGQVPLTPQEKEEIEEIIREIKERISSLSPSRGI